jgi:hypothetical protein
VTYTKEQLRDKFLRMLDDPAVRVLEATVYFETVDQSHNIHATTRTLRYEREDYSRPEE